MTHGRRFLVGALTGLFLVLLAGEFAASSLADWPFTTDDAYITLRYARNLAAGEGPNWNPGEPPVEGYSNFTYVLLGAAVIALDGDPVLAIKLAGVVSLGLALALLVWIVGSESNWVLGPAAAFLYLAYWGVPFWAASGLETATHTMLALAAIAAAAWGLGERRRGAAGFDRDRRGWLAVAGGLILLDAWTRPEGPIVGMAIAVGIAAEAVVRVWRPRGLSVRAVAREAGRLLTPVLLTSALPYLLYAGWRLAYFGDLVPNSVRCKAFVDPADLLVGDALRLLMWPLPFAIYAVVRRPRFLRVSLATFVVLSVSILGGVDPIIGHGNRHVLAAFAAACVLATLGVWELAAAARRRLSPAVIASVLTLIAVTWSFSDLDGRLRFVRGVGESYTRRTEARRELANWLNLHTLPHDRVLVGDTGVVGYLARARIVDAFCLNCRATPRPPIDRDPRAFARWVFARPPKILVVHSSSGDRLIPRPEEGVYPALVADPAFTRDYRLRAIFGRPGGDFYYFAYQLRGSRDEW